MTESNGHYQALKPGRLPSSEGKAFLITPEWSSWALETYNKHNRKRVERVVERYSDEIRANTFRLTHQGIAFSSEPTALIDGQHRLFAIVETGIAIPLRIFTEQDQENQLVVDDHKIRSVADAFTLSGLAVSNQEVAIANAFRAGPSPSTTKGRMSKSQMRDFVSEHIDAIRFALSCRTCKVRGLSAPVLAVAARAYYHADVNRIRQFFRPVCDGVAIKDDSSINTPLALRRYLTETSSGATGSSAKSELYRKTQRMLRAYLDEEELLKCIGTDKDLFPLL